MQDSRDDSELVDGSAPGTTHVNDAASPAIAERPIAPAPTVPAAPGMDRDFIARNQIVERYFANKLPAKGALDFERYCRENPEILDELHVSERVHAGVRLMEAGGLSLPWEVRQKRFWEKLPVIVGLAIVAVGASAATLTYLSLYGRSETTVAGLRERLAAQPLDPIKSTRSVKIELNRTGPPAGPAATLSTSHAELADLRLLLGWSTYTQFRVTIDRSGQGRAIVLNGLQRDSNGEVRIGLNSSLFGPGLYQIQIEGISPRGDYAAQAWTAVAFAR